MSIQAAEMIWRYPVTNDDTAANGGRMTSNIITPGGKNNIWPDVSQAERTAGSDKHRKVFIHVANDDDITLVRPRIFVETFTPGDDSVTIFLSGNMNDTAASVSGSEDKYGCGDLDSPAASGQRDITVITEDAALDYFRVGDLIRISDKADVDAVGNEEYHTIAAGGVSAYTGDVVTLTVEADLVHTYAAAGTTRVASVLEPADVKASYDTVNVTGGGTFTDAGNISTDSISTVEQDWTILFSDATNFVLTSDDPSLAINLAGTTSGNLQPNNPDFSKPYFIIDSVAFGGGFSNGDTITFSTRPAAVPVWYRRIIPAGANSLTGNKVIVAIDGESE